MRPIDDLIDAFCFFDGRYKRAEIDEARSRREEVVPRLIGILESVSTDPARFADDENFFGHLYAVMLLGHFRETAAHRLVLDLMALPGDLPDRLFTDLITEDMPMVLLNTCGGRFDGIKELALNGEAYEFCRMSALTAIKLGVASGELDREEAVAFLQGIIETGEQGTPSSLISSTACDLMDLYPGESMEVIRDAYEKGTIEPGFVGYDAFEDALESGKDACLEELREKWEERSLEDIHGRMSWWACFNEPSPALTAVNWKNVDRKSKKHKKSKTKMAKASRRKNRRKRKK